MDLATLPLTFLPCSSAILWRRNTDQKKNAIFTCDEDEHRLILNSFHSKEEKTVQSENEHKQRPTKRPHTEALQGKGNSPAQIREPEKDELPRKKCRAEAGEIHTPFSVIPASDDPSQRAGIPIKRRPAFPDYTLRYIVVRDMPQRLRYQKDYDAHYDEYCALRAQVERAVELLVLWAAQHRNLPPKKCYGDYKQCKRLLADRQKKLVFLRDRLLHIKRLCDDFELWRKSSGVWFQSIA